MDGIFLFANAGASSAPGIECRSGGANSNYTMVFTFNNSITSCGIASSGTVSSGPDANQCTVQLTNVPNAQYTIVQLTGVTDNNANTVNAAGTMGVLVGDVNGNKTVDGNDVSAVQSNTRQPVNSTTFRSDVNVNGVIDGNDVSLTQGQTRTSLP